MEQVLKEGEKCKYIVFKGFNPWQKKFKNMLFYELHVDEIYHSME